MTDWVMELQPIHTNRALSPVVYQRNVGLSTNIISHLTYKFCLSQLQSKTDLNAIWGIFTKLPTCGRYTQFYVPKQTT